jgi:hypothetical protein
MDKTLGRSGHQKMPVCRSVAGNGRKKVVVDGKLRRHEVVVIQIITIEEAHHSMPVLIGHMDPQAGCNLTDVETYRDKAIHGRTG